MPGASRVPPSPPPPTPPTPADTGGLAIACGGAPSALAKAPLRALAVGGGGVDGTAASPSKTSYSHRLDHGAAGGGGVRVGVGEAEDPPMRPPALPPTATPRPPHPPPPATSSSALLQRTRWLMPRAPPREPQPHREALEARDPAPDPGVCGVCGGGVWGCGDAGCGDAGGGDAGCIDTASGGVYGRRALAGRSSSPALPAEVPVSARTSSPAGVDRPDNRSLLPAPNREGGVARARRVRMLSDAHEEPPSSSSVESSSSRLMLTLVRVAGRDSSPSAAMALGGRSSLRTGSTVIMPLCREAT